MLIESQQGSTRILTLDRQDAGNALSLELVVALEEALAKCRTDSSLRSVIITGAGEKFFCTGGDVKRYSTIENAEGLHEIFDRAAGVLDLVESCELPVFAAINGYAIGGGLELALACDMRFAAAGVQMGFPQSRLGIIPGWNGIERVLAVAGRGTAMRLLLSGDRVDATEAHRLGLVDFVAQGESALDAALRYAARLDTAAPQSLKAMKQVVAQTLQAPRDQARMLARSEFGRLWFTADHKEAEAAFAQKRAPQFSGG